MGELIAMLFLAREIAHRAHLATPSYAQHMALGEFYRRIVEDADALAEAWQGRNGVIDIPLGDMTPDEDIVVALQRHVSWIEANRDRIAGEDRPIQNLIDTALATYLTALYKLRHLM